MANVDDPTRSSSTSLACPHFFPGQGLVIRSLSCLLFQMAFLGHSSELKGSPRGKRASLSSGSTQVPPWRQPRLEGTSPDLLEPFCALTHSSAPAQWQTGDTALNLLLLLTVLSSSFCWPFRTTTFLGRSHPICLCIQQLLVVDACYSWSLHTQRSAHVVGSLGIGLLGQRACGFVVQMDQIDPGWPARFPGGCARVAPANDVRLSFLTEIPVSGPGGDSPTSLSARIPLWLPWLLHEVEDPRPGI